MEINEQIARRLRLLRDEAGLTIEALAARSGVSRAMISRIERAQSSPSAEVLNKLSLGFGLRLSQLLEFGSYAEPGLRRRNPVASRRSQAQWQDPVSGYLRRTLTPSTAEHPVQLCELQIPPKVTVSFENVFGAVILQQIWLLEGELEVTLGGEVASLRKGDCMALALNAPLGLRNPATKPARYLLASAQPDR